MVENIDFFMAFTKNYPDVKWRVLHDPIFVGLLRHRREQGQRRPARCPQHRALRPAFLEYVNETWEKWYGAPMLVKVEANPYF